jgi:hypothetical protein
LLTGVPKEFKYWFVCAKNVRPFETAKIHTAEHGNRDYSKQIIGSSSRAENQGIVEQKNKPLTSAENLFVAFRLTFIFTLAPPFLAICMSCGHG